MKMHSDLNIRGPYFEGLYFKLQSASGFSLGIIPALHIDKYGQRSYSMQLITNDESFCISCDSISFSISKKSLKASADESLFTDRGICLNIEKPGLSLHGAVLFGPPDSLRYDIMGPFALIKGMECSHFVLSMAHKLRGSLKLNGREIDFTGGIGYTEGDRGRSFPEKYLWTQCCWQSGRLNSIMLACARIPAGLISFNGCIAALHCKGKEYRLASYKGAEIEVWSRDYVLIRQGNYKLEAKLIDKSPLPLKAPAEGCMSRIVKESVCSKVSFTLSRRDKIILEHTDNLAGFEFSDALN